MARCTSCFFSLFSLFVRPLTPRRRLASSAHAKGGKEEREGDRRRHNGENDKASVRPTAAVLVVVTVVAMVSLPPLIDRHDRVPWNWLSERPIPWATILKVQALEEGMADPVD